MSEYHTPVMLDESISALVTNPSGTYADVTFGGGGHTAELLSRLNEDGHVIAFDRDSDAINNRIDDPRLTMVRADFRFIHNFVLNEAHETEDQTLKEKLTGGLDGILADLGVSSHQFDTAERGFSFRYDAPLDMRMNREGGKTAADVVNEYSGGAFWELSDDKTMTSYVPDSTIYYCADGADYQYNVTGLTAGKQYKITISYDNGNKYYVTGGLKVEGLGSTELNTYGDDTTTG